MKKIGVLALQGDFIEHINMLEAVGVKGVEIRLPEQLDDVSGLIMPGGESTTIIKLIEKYGFKEKLTELARKSFPIWGTCAGLIVLCKKIPGYENQPTLGIFDAVVHRNGYGRQVDSFEEDISIKGIGDGLFRAVFIRAPIIEEIGENVEVLSKLNNGQIVVAKQNNIIVSTFHPELTNDLRFHEFFSRFA